MCDECILPGNGFVSDDSLASGCKTPGARSEGLVQCSSVPYLGHVYDSIRLDFHGIGFNRCEQDVCCFFRKSFLAEAMERF